MTGLLGDVLGHALVLGALDRRLVRRHADAVGNDVGQDLVVPDRGQVEGLQSQVVLAVEPGLGRGEGGTRESARQEVRQSPEMSCFCWKARRELENANVIVTNHALLFSDLALREEDASILPDYNWVIIDEGA